MTVTAVVPVGRAAASIRVWRDPLLRRATLWPLWATACGATGSNAVASVALGSHDVTALGHVMARVGTVRKGGLLDPQRVPSVRTPPRRVIQYRSPWLSRHTESRFR